MVQRKRKHAAVESTQTTLTAAMSPNARKTQTTIAAFTRVTKSGSALTDCAKKRKTEATSEEVAAPKVTSITASTTTTKRKRNVEEQSEPRRPASPCPAEAPSTPRSKRSRMTLPPQPETPSRGAVALFDKLNLARQQEETCSVILPDEVEELRDLYAAFLSALSLHYSHNGTASPVNVRALLPSITSHWKKRAVTIDDLRRILAIADGDRQTSTSAACFALEDFGRAGICLTRPPSSSRSNVAQPSTRLGTYIDEAEMNASFTDALEHRWRAWTSTVEKENARATTFLSQILPAAIQPNASAQKAAPLFARGQQRLADLKAGAPHQSPSSSSSPLPTTTTTTTTTTLQTRNTALLDRILAKQSHLSTLAPAPSRAALARRAALHRCEDIVRVLTLLAGGARPGGSNSSSSTFSLAALTQQIRQSIRSTPLSNDEVERGLEVLAREIAPGFVRIVRQGGVVAVVVTRGLALGVGEVRRRVEVACRREGEL